MKFKHVIEFDDTEFAKYEQAKQYLSEGQAPGTSEEPQDPPVEPEEPPVEEPETPPEEPQDPPVEPEEPTTPANIKLLVDGGEVKVYNWSWGASFDTVDAGADKLLKATVNAWGGIKLHISSAGLPEFSYLVLNLATEEPAQLNVTANGSGTPTALINAGTTVKTFILPCVNPSTVIITPQPLSASAVVYIEEAYLSDQGVATFDVDLLTPVTQLPSVLETPIPDYIPVPNLPTNTKPLTVDGNKIKTSDGQVWQGRGVNIFDTRSCNALAYNQPNADEVIRKINFSREELGANFFRLCLESYDQAEGRTHWAGVLEDQQYVDDLVKIVNHVGTLPGVYIMLSLWTEPSFDALGRPTEKTALVWKYLSSIFGALPHVLFGVANEPENNYNGADDAFVITQMQLCVDTIRSTGANNIVAVQGTGGWARRMTPYLNRPINDSNVVYECHPYNAFDPAQWFDVAQTLPVILGEFGPVDASYGSMTDDDIRETVARANEMDVSWTGWALHHRCPPNMLASTSGGIGAELVLSDWGLLLKELINS